MLYNELKFQNILRNNSNKNNFLIQVNTIDKNGRYGTEPDHLICRQGKAQSADKSVISILKEVREKKDKIK